MKYLASLTLFLFLFTACQEETKLKYAPFPESKHLNAKIAGFETQTIKEGEGEWLSIHLDPQGRLLVSPRKGNLLRFSIPNDSIKNLQIDTLDIGVYDCQSLLYTYGQLYMMGTNRDTVRGIHRVPDLDGQGNYGEPILMKEVPKNGDHSGHTLTLGAAGNIYFLSGNENRVPEGVDKVYSDYRNDHLMPLASLFGTNQVPPGGYVLRTDSVGNDWQLFAYGLRNPYDMCFSPEGELFTFDSDMEWDFNLPWYRPTRVNHLVSGGDYAWRQSTAKRFDYYPDILPAVQDFGRGSPTATLFGTGAAFPTKYQNALFLGDWSYGRIYAMHLSPDGATYKSNYETFITGQPLNITDMVVGQDGALYFTTGGNGTDTGLYRIIYTGEKSTKAVQKRKQVHPNLKLRRKLEQYHFAKDDAGLELALEYIGHEDRFVRYAAKTIIERNSPETWKNEVAKSKNTTRKMTLLTALIRSDSMDTYQDLIFEQLKTFDYSNLSEQEQLGLLRLYALAFLRSKKIPKQYASETYERLQVFYPTETPNLNKELSRVLCYLATLTESGDATIAKTLDLLEYTNDPVLFVHYLEVLRKVPKHWTEQQLSAYQYWMNYAKANLTGGSLFKHFLKEIEKEFKTTRSNEAQAWLAEIEAAPIRKDYEGPVPPKPKVTTNTFDTPVTATNWKLEDLQYELELVSSPRGQIRDFNRGQKMFQKGQCYNCHYMIDKGGGFGPDMTLAGNSFSAEDLLVAILHPSKDLNSRFLSTVFELKDGNSIAGRLMTEDRDRYVIQASYDPASTQEVMKNQVQSKEAADYSDMPIGLVNTMSRGEILDLLYFIIQVAGKSKERLNMAIFNEQDIIEQGDSSLVEMIAFGEKGDIFYTLDGSEPTETATKYTVPFFVKESTLIKAKIISKGESGEIQTQVIHAVNRSLNGLDWQLYLDVPERFNLPKNRQADETGVAYHLNVNAIVDSENGFELHFEGYLQIDKAGEYTFYTQEDDAVKLYLDNKLVVDAADGNWTNEAVGKTYLSAGKHALNVEFYDNLAFEYLFVEYESDAMSRRPVMGDKLFRADMSL